MRLRPVCVATLLAALAGCGADTDAATVEKVIEEDWNAAAAGEATWPGRPELEGTTAEDVRCADPEPGTRVRCTVRLERGAARDEVPVVAELDEGGTLVGWQIGTS